MFRPEEPGGLGLMDTTGRNMRCKPSGLHGRGVTLFRVRDVIIGTPIRAGSL